MKPPLIPPAPRPVSLKPSTPAVLQTSFGDEQWVNAANLARQRYRVTKDPYYLAVEVAAKSQSDNVADRNAGKVAVEAMVKDKTIITDVDTLDLYELACHRVDIKYSETIGALRARLVKAIPKDQASCSRCLDACVWNSDWKNAQQIAASLHKNFGSEHKFLFRYILATHQYALSDDCPENSRKIFGSLARAQADKAFDFRVMTAGSGYYVSRGANDESEGWMWLIIRLTHCEPKDNAELFKKPEYGPLAFLEAGHFEPYWSLMNYLQDLPAWDYVFQVAKQILEEATRICQNEASAIEADENVISLRALAKDEAQQNSSTAESSVKKDLVRAIEKARPGRSLKDHAYVNACCEYELLMILFRAASLQPDRKRAFKKVRQLCDKMAKALVRAECMKPIFQKAYDLLAMCILFERDTQAALGRGSSTRIINLTSYVIKHYQDPQCLTEAMSFFGTLSKAELALLLNSLRTRGIKCADHFQGIMLMSISLSMRYSIATEGGLTCELCDNALEGSDCVYCLRSIAISALEAYKSGMDDDNLTQNILPKQSVNPLSDIAVVGATCLLKLARLGRGPSPQGNSSLFNADIQLFLQAVLWLDFHASTPLPKTTTHSLLLAKLYLLMGCVARAKALWGGLDIKNALLDSLGLLYIDRLSSIAPGVFLSGRSYDNPVEPFMVHFTRGLRSTIPKRIMNSLEMGTYPSIGSMIQFAEKQTASCTLVMAVIEERRGLRMKAGKIETCIDDNCLVRNLSIEHDLVDITDYNAYAIPRRKNTEEYVGGEKSKPIHAIVNYGPLPTGTRAHLGLLAERFLDFVCYVQPKEYKPSKAGQIIQLDWKYAVAASCHLENSMRTILGVADSKLSVEEKAKLCRQQEDLKATLTSAENWYHSIVYRLASAVQNIMEHAIVSAPTNQIRDLIRHIVTGIVQTLEGQTHDFLAVPNNIQSKRSGFHGFAALHAMGMLRESIIAVKYTANYLTAAAEKAKNMDKGRTAADLAWLAPEIKKMTAAATESENTIKARIKLLKSYLDNVNGWRDRLCEWALDDSPNPYDQNKDFKVEMTEKLKAIVPKAKAELWGDSVSASWQDVMRGWANVKFD